MVETPPYKFSESWKVGGANRDRTDDLYNAIVALSQLSYGPNKFIYTFFCVKKTRPLCQQYLTIFLPFLKIG